MRFSRRNFIGTSVFAGSFFIGGCASSGGVKGGRRPAPSDRVTLGVIGCGGMGRANMDALLQDPRVQVVKVCDCVAGTPEGVPALHLFGYEHFRARVNKFYGNNDCRVTADWREVVADPGIDAVLISSSDHWHALQGIAAMRAGKHVYCQKPLTIAINDGREMVRVAKETGVVFQVGNQGRSASAKRIAAEIVRNGYLGECRSATVTIPGGPNCRYVRREGAAASPEPLPDYFTPEGWQMWLGPSRHWPDDAFIPAIHSQMTWRLNNRTGGGIIPDFGAHDVDTVQWALGRDRSGPVAIENAKFGSWREPREVFSWADVYEMDFVYADGFRLHVQNTRPGVSRSVVFHGEKGDLKECLYSGEAVKLQLPPSLKKWREKKNLKDTDIHLHAPKDGHSHESDFIDGIYGGETATDCEIGHRTTSVCLIANIAQRLGVSSLMWDPDREIFTGANAAAANRLLDIPYYNGWKL